MKLKVGIIGTGAMGAGIAQVAAMHNCEVLLFDTNQHMLDKAMQGIASSLQKMEEKQKINAAEKLNTLANLSTQKELNGLKDCDLIIEAIVEDLDIKQQIFSTLDDLVSKECILASNTSSLSIASIASACKNAERVIGIHFFNPAVLMPLVEIIPALTTNVDTVKRSVEIIASWKKVVVKAKDTPGFIVNRLARSFYGESIKMYEEGMADFATIDYALKSLGGFKMGPFELMDFIGNDINYKVTETVWQQFFYDPRFRPSLTQKRLYEAKLFGRKSGRGYYDYANPQPIEPIADKALHEKIVKRVLVMLINEAAETLLLQVASKEDLDMAMVKGVNYPQGLLKWADELGLEQVLNELTTLHTWFGDDRYRPSILLKQMVKEGKTFY